MSKTCYFHHLIPRFDLSQLPISNGLMAVFTRPSAIIYRLREADGLNAL